MTGLAFETGQLADWPNSKKNIFFFIYEISFYLCNIYILPHKKKKPSN
jgi:hypothetical protein